jgi:glycosyltransferase involved in cell wall biosynthesis
MKASIIINNYNYAHYLEYCLRSATEQTHPDCEVILYDDGSSDHSRDVWSRFPAVRVLAHPNHGKYASFNQANAIYQALRVASGDIICLLDADDAFLPTKVARVVDAFARRPGVAMVQHRMFEIDERSARTGRTRINILDGIDVRAAIYATGGLEYLFMQTSSLAFRRRVLEKLLPIDETRFPEVWADVRLSRAAIFHGDVETIYEPLGEYRVHPLGRSNKVADQAAYREFRAQQYAYFAEVARAHGAPPLPQGNELIVKAKALVYAARHATHGTAFIRRALAGFIRSRLGR